MTKKYTIYLPYNSTQTVEGDELETSVDTGIHKIYKYDPILGPHFRISVAVVPANAFITIQDNLTGVYASN